MPIQNAIGGVPVVFDTNPKEGKQVSRFAFTLTNAQPNYSVNFQLNSSNGLNQSQVVTLCIDNTQNKYPLTVIHGALNETVDCPGGASIIVPTLSNKSGYPLNVSAQGGISPSIPMSFNVILMNYTRSAGTFYGTITQALSGVGQNTRVLSSGVYNLSLFNSFAVVVPQGNWQLDNLDMAFEGFQPAAAGTVSNNLNLPTLAISNVLENLTIAAMGFGFNAASTDWIQGGQLVKAVRRTWYGGLGLPAGASIVFDMSDQFSPFGNLTSAIVRINISGVGDAL
jgi:hypothetical protein